MRWPRGIALALLLGLGAAVGPVVPAAPARAAVEPVLPAVDGPVVLVGTAGVRWSDVDPDATPALWSLLQDGAVASLAARSVRTSACPADGWLAVSSGRLAADGPTSASGLLCESLGVPTPGTALTRWPVYVDRADDDGRSARPGELGEALGVARVPVAGIGAGAAIALADLTGTAVGPVLPLDDDAAALTTTVEDSVAGVALLVVDVGVVHADLAAPRAEQLRAVDAGVGAVLAGLPPGATVLVASLADDGDEPHLQLLAATGPGGEAPYADALLGSRSTRQPGLVQTTDLAPTLLHLVGVPAPSTFVGSPVTPGGRDADPAARLQAVLDDDAAAQAVRPATVWFFAGFVVLQLVGYGAVLLALRRTGPDDPRRHRLLVWVRRTAVLLASVPVATYPANLVPWWRAGAPSLVLVATVLALAAVLAAVALLGPWRRALLGPLGVVGAVTATVLAVDVATGSRLMISSLMGLQPLVAGRFYGLGNVAFALFATGALLAATAVADSLVRAGRRTDAIVAVVLVGLAATLVDGLPGLGSDFGGPLAIVPAFALLVVLLARLRSSWGLGAAIAGGSVAVVAAISVLDWLRPADERTHLGRFVDAVMAGESGEVVARKLEQNLSLLITPTGPFVVLLVVLLVLAVRRPERLRLTALRQAYDHAPALQPGLSALLVLLALGFALNDSGTAVPSVAAAITVPLLIATSIAVAAGRPGQPGRSAAPEPLQPTG